MFTVSPYEDTKYENDGSNDNGERSTAYRAFPILTITHATLREISVENAAVRGMVPGVSVH